MDSLAALQSRIEQLEARLGSVATEALAGEDVGRGGEPATATATQALLAAASCIDTATAGQEKLATATRRASELNNYTDPNFIQNLQESEMNAQEILTSEKAINHHCNCMQKIQKAAPVLESEALQAVPQLQADLTHLQAGVAHLRVDADQVGAGVQGVAETCGAAAASAADALINVAKQVEATENKLFPKRRNGLD